MTDTTGKRITDWLKQGGDIFAELGKDAGEYFSQIMPDLEKTLKAKIRRVKIGTMTLEPLIGYMARAGGDVETAISLIKADIEEQLGKHIQLRQEASRIRLEGVNTFNSRVEEARAENTKAHTESSRLDNEAFEYEAKARSLQALLDLLESKSSDAEQEEAEEEKIA